VLRTVAAGNALKTRLPRAAYGRGRVRIALGKVVMPHGACVDFWNALNMRPLSLNDDSLNEEDDRQKTQGGGSRNKSNKILNKKKNSAIVRVCQLRMIVWLVETLSLCLLPVVFRRRRFPALT
jgi:hypothetical protein